ncbi:SIMPL domain-containing protein [Helicobacter sp. MIT 05-5294]|uniref:SIMPL domain-containing protein n=1 Tax=Helicobacter sp. MIT 05-5294 TaxID=1548150 RepID=UPI00051F99F9|nr:SIMPL domain-containing protein [Helicobacter sp. MIT 05-5294]TLD85859.1 SIMPL domain-containing protein [Helicobacter sp. MIT 05-5294]
MDKISAIVLGVCLIVSSAILGMGAKEAIKEFRAGERSVVVKGLSEKEVAADVMILPLKFRLANNDLHALYTEAERNSKKIVEFLQKLGFHSDEITIGSPNITDKLSNEYGSDGAITYRYSGSGEVILYTKQVALGREIFGRITELGLEGIVIKINAYEVEYGYTQLNAIKPQMIEESTLKARESALKFAKDSNSKLGKIKRATQGQFSITNRDQNTPHIKNIRVVSTIEYYLED